MNLAFHQHYLEHNPATTEVGFWQQRSQLIVAKMLLFYFLLVANLWLLAAVFISLGSWERRIYPPPKQHSWQNYAFLAFHHLTLLGFFIIGALDWNSFVFRHLAWRFVGGIILAVGLFIAFWAVSILTFRRSAGYNIALRDSGPYKYTRNPQVIGFLVGFTGYILLANSLLTLIVGILSMVYVLITVYLEERWLQELIGPDYVDYCKNTRRFV